MPQVGLPARKEAIKSLSLCSILVVIKGIWQKMAFLFYPGDEYVGFFCY